MNKKTLGQFIAELRKEKGLTQRELSEMIGVSDKTVSHWERDESSPDISLLLTLSDIFGITVDELLKREKNTPFGDTVIPSQSENSMKESKNSEKSHKVPSVEERFRRYKLLSLIGTVLGVLSLMNTLSSGMFLSEFSDIRGIPTVTKTMPLLSVLRLIIISLIATVGARFYFSTDFVPEEANEESIYTYKANRIFTLNLYLVLAVIIFSIAPLFSFIPYITLYLITALLTAVMIIAIDSLLKAKGFLKPKNEKIFRMRIITVITAAALILAGGGFWGFAEWYTPTPKEIAFDNIGDFVAYMETPTPKPEEAWRIDGVLASTLPPTSAPTQTTNQSPVGQIPETTKPAFYYASVYDVTNGKPVTFKLLNGNVYRYYASTEEQKYYVKTYEAELKVKDWGKVQDMMSYIIPFYCMAVIVLSFIVYMIKAKKLRV